MKALLFRTGVLAVAGWLLPLGCDRTDATPARAEVMALTADPDRAETYVQARFQTDDSLRAHDIDVSAVGGRVTLRGTVPTEEARQRAVAAARGVSGVQSVEDQLVVVNNTPTMPPSAGTTPLSRQATNAATPRPDQARQPGWITTKIQAQYFANPEISPWHIDVTTASNGVVTLRGSVEDASDRNEAVRIARTTEGVTSVDDQLTIGQAVAATDAAGDPNQSDSWISAKIQSKYFLDAEVKGRDIDVDTQNGLVTLRGSVGSESERRHAIAIARTTSGVRDVNDRLAITPATSSGNDQSGLARAADAADDAWVTIKIQSKFFLDPDIKGSAINVNTSDGVVTLQGTVESATDKQSAEQIAKATDGVASVRNELKVATTR